MNRRPTLAFVAPHYGPVDTQVHKNHLAVIANASRTFDVKFVGISDKMYLHNACNSLAKEALMNTVDYVMWVEMDMLLPFDTVTRLYNNQKDICAGLYFLRGAAFMPCMWMYATDSGKDRFKVTPVCLFPENELIKVDNPGMGCVLYKTDIFRKLKEPFFDMQEGKFGQDVYFYRMVKDAGIEVWVDTSVQCEQQGDKYITSIRDYREHLKLNKEKQGFIVNK